MHLWCPTLTSPSLQMVLLFAFDIHLFLMESDASKLYWLCTMAVISAFYLLVLAHPLIPCNRWTRLPGTKDSLLF
jgi:hypothetical protein